MEPYDDIARDLFKIINRTDPTPSEVCWGAQYLDLKAEKNALNCELSLALRAGDHAAVRRLEAARQYVKYQLAALDVLRGE